MAVCRPSSLLAAGLLVVAVDAAATSYLHGPRPIEQEIDVRELPSLFVEWQWKSSVDEWRMEDGVVYAVGGDRLSAIDAVTGASLWDYDLELDCSCSSLEVLPTRIVAGIDGRAILVDRASGALAADVALGESITSLLPDPLVLAYRDALESHGLVRLDEVSGVEIGRYLPSGDLSSVERLGKRLVVRGRAGGREHPTLTGLDLSLTEIWHTELPEGSWSRREGDEIVVETRGRDATRWTLDPATGDLLPRVRRAATDEDATEVVIEELAGGLALVLENKKLPRLIRPGRGTDEAVWEVDLPVVVTASAEWGEDVVLAKKAWGGRGVLFIVNRADGRILSRVAGLRGMSKLRTLGDLLITDTANGLAAVRLDEFGPSDAASTTVQAAVSALFAELADPRSGLEPYSVSQEFEALGSEALPFLTEAIPGAANDVVAMIAKLVSAADYRPAAPVLAERVLMLIEGPRLESEDDESERRSHLEQMAYALARIARAEEMPVLDRFLDSEQKLGYARLPAMAALGRFAPDRAASQLSRLRQRHAHVGDWLTTPSAEAWLEAAELELEPAALEDFWTSAPSDELWLRMRALQTAITESESGRWIVFPDEQFGVRALWAARLGEDGLPGTSLFLGVGAPQETADPDAGGLAMLEARLTDSRLDIAYSGVDVLSVELAELDVDSDGDGLSDRLEEFLALDPEAADSDGDGLRDPADPAPHGRGGRAVSEQEAALLVLHETLWLAQAAEEAASRAAAAETRTEPSEPGHVFLTEVPALEWRGGPGATFVGASEGMHGCRAQSYRPAQVPPRALDEDEIALEVIIPCAIYGSSYPGETYVLKATESGWVLSGVDW